MKFADLLLDLWDHSLDHDLTISQGIMTPQMGEQKKKAEGALVVWYSTLTVGSRKSQRAFAEQSAVTFSRTEVALFP